MHLSEYYKIWMNSVDEYKLAIQSGLSKERIEDLRLQAREHQKEYVNALARAKRNNPDIDPTELLQVNSIDVDAVGAVRRLLGVEEPLNQLKYIVFEVRGYQGDTNHIYLQLKFKDTDGDYINYKVTENAIGPFNKRLPVDWNDIGAVNRTLAKQGHDERTGAFFEQITSKTCVRFVVELDIEATLEGVEITPHPEFSLPKCLSVYKSDDPLDLSNGHNDLCIEGCVCVGTLGCTQFNENEVGITKFIKFDEI